MSAGVEMGDPEIEFSVEMPGAVVILRFVEPTTREMRRRVQAMAKQVSDEIGIRFVVLPHYIRPEAPDGGLSALEERVAKLEKVIDALVGREEARDG